MTTPQAGVPAIDEGNQLLADGPCQLTVKKIDTPGGARLVHTVRTMSTTCTVLLTREDAESWVSAMRDELTAMRTGLWTPGGPQAVQIAPNGKPHG
jgi:hypothetical protein